MSMGERSERKGNSEILKKTYHILQENPISINELAERLESNWATAKKAIDTLEDIGLVSQQEKKGAAKIYFVNRELEPLVPQSETLFNLPLKEEQIRFCHCLYAKIKQKWQVKTKQVPNKIHAQKIASHVVRKFPQLGIPHVWYLYGNTLVYTYIPIQDYSECNLASVSEKEIDKELDTAVDKYSKTNNSLTAMKLQYAEDEAPEIYSTKLELHSLLSKYDLDTKEVRDKILSLLTKLRSELDKVEDTKRIHSFLFEFTGIMNRAFQQKQVNEFRLQINSTFEKIWELISIYNFAKSAKEWFDEGQIKANTTPKLKRVIIDVQENLMELEGLFPQTVALGDLKKYDFLTKLKGSLKEAPKRTNEQREEDFEEFAKKIKNS